jgi:hypothetical protein
MNRASQFGVREAGIRDNENFLINEVAQGSALIVVDDDRDFIRKAGFPKSRYKRSHLLRRIVCPGDKNEW